MSLPLKSYGEVAEIVAAQARRFASRQRATEELPLGLAAGRILAGTLHADRDLPPFARSTRDGYACRATEAAAHKSLFIAGSIRAGEAPKSPLPSGTAWEIMTGAPVPEGADAVAMLEHVDIAGGAVCLANSRSLEVGENIVPRGAEARKGDEVLAAGIRLAPQQIALAAACGYATVPVFARPRVAILTTGDELVPVEAAPGPAQIRNSNAPMLAALVAATGGKPVILPKAADEAEALDIAIERAASADLLIVSGGVSAGKFDLVEGRLGRSGATFYFTGARIQPGKPVVFGELRREAVEGKGAGGSRRIQPFFGLPGNPISSAATFLLFVAPVLGALAGAAELGPRFGLARLAKDCKGKPDLTRFVPARCTFGGAAGEPPQVAPIPTQGSGDLAAFSRSNCFLVVSEGVQKLHADEVVRILLC
jgi:molybdopterin molybdotransferase